MKIGLNGQMLLIDKFAGPEVYTYNVFQNLAKEDKTNKYVIYFTQIPANEFWTKLTGNNPNFSYKIISSKISWTQWGLMWELIKHPVDIFFTASHTIPFIHHPRTNIVSMIHGLEYKVNRQYSPNSLKYFIHPIILWWILIFSKIVVVPSIATKIAIQKSKFLFIDLNKVKIIPEGVDKSFYKRGDIEVRAVLEKYNINFDQYLIFVSTIQPRKNIPIMIKSFANIISTHKKLKNTGLVICGKLGWLYKESIDAPQKYKIVDNVKFLGRISDEDLPILLSGAKYFINLSLEEGFGIPLLEAMACKLPAIVSDIPAFKEIGQNFQTYVCPTNLNQITEKLYSALSTQPDINKINKAYELSQKYTWDITAQKLLEIFGQCFKN